MPISVAPDSRNRVIAEGKEMVSFSLEGQSNRCWCGCETTQVKDCRLRDP